MAVRYLAVLRMSSMGRDSVMRAARAAAMVSGVMRLLRRDCSVAVQAGGDFAEAGGADSYVFDDAVVSCGRGAARATLEMACALRVPTLRM